ncbi:hypothetical protein [Flagellimonas pacifica]|uniref:Uncharacterized protein n=1 Tax=Flagellimonas pacifica TaxID=1247520 RepID=A0A285MZX8_9FLAO|nr:hypothetical protein [Allomuricauda parva]SNZ01336.1 hypothetical protein SAMN06265377_3174 [Allomuricauda parva]
MIPKIGAALFLMFFLNFPLSSQEGLDDYIIEYRTITRGMSERIVVKEKIFIYHSTRNSKTTDSLEIKDEQRARLVKLLEGLSFKGLPYLKAPSDKRLADAAAHAKLKISIKKRAYESSGFDHGNPPEEIRDLVEYILNISGPAQKKQ